MFIKKPHKEKTPSCSKSLIHLHYLSRLLEPILATGGEHPQQVTRLSQGYRLATEGEFRDANEMKRF